MSFSLSSAQINTCLLFPPTEWNRLSKHKKHYLQKPKLFLQLVTSLSAAVNLLFFYCPLRSLLLLCLVSLGLVRWLRKWIIHLWDATITPCWIAFVSINVASACFNVSLFELNTWSLLCPNVAMFQSWGLCSALSLFPYYLNILI